MENRTDLEKIINGPKKDLDSYLSDVSTKDFIEDIKALIEKTKDQNKEQEWYLVDITDKEIKPDQIVPKIIIPESVKIFIEAIANAEWIDFSKVYIINSRRYKIEYYIKPLKN